MKRTFLLSLIALTLTLPSWSLAAGGEYAGADACAGCHEEIGAAFGTSLHAKAWGGGYDQACESCHGPGAEHAASPSRESIGTFGREALRGAAEQSEPCLGCHADSQELAMWDQGIHRKRDISCASCHDIHGGYSPVASMPDTCYGCHLDVKIDANKQSRHPIREGKVLCGDCHNPHGTLTRNLVRNDTLNDLCYGCHADKRGPYMWEHPPVEENCSSCHEPHGSNHRKLLTQKVPNLCQSCHVWSRHPGTPYDRPTSFLGRAPSNRFFGRSCQGCHVNIHGSMAPNDPLNSGHKNGQAFLR